MNFLSVCSGIEAASVAWNPLGWKAAAFSEIEPFPCSVLAHHYPTIPNLGDMNNFNDWTIPSINLLCGGTPCQSFSVAGLRKGLADPRGNLALVFLGILDKFRPRWVVWENVPGVPSSDEGRDFGTFLGALGQLGYGFAYRVLDAQYFGVPQRRRRPFVVGYLGDWRPPAAVLFERHCLQGHPAPRRQAGKDVAPTLDVRAGRSGETSFATSGGLVAHTLLGKPNCSHADDQETYVVHSLTGNGFDASEDGTGRGTPLVPVGINGGDVGFTLRAEGSHSGDKGDGGMNTTMVVAETLTGSWHNSGGAKAGNNSGVMNPVFERQGVRRLTPRECERLQGFPDDYTMVPHRGKPAADGPRYKAIGNSWAVPCAGWIGRRIESVEAILKTSGEGR